MLVDVSSFRRTMDPILATFTFFENITVWGIWAWNIGYLLRTFYAKGTWGRYVGHSLARPGIHVCIVHWCLVVITNLLEGEYLFAGLSLFLVALYVFIYVVIESKYNDDDNFWKGTKRKLKRWVRARRLAMKGRLAPA